MQLHVEPYLSCNTAEFKSGGIQQYKAEQW